MGIAENIVAKLKLHRFGDWSHTDMETLGTGFVLLRAGWQFTFKLKLNILNIEVSSTLTDTMRDGASMQCGGTMVSRKDGFFRESPNLPERVVVQKLIEAIETLLTRFEEHVKRINEKVKEEEDWGKRRDATRAAENAQLDKVLARVRYEAKPFIVRGKESDPTVPVLEVSTKRDDFGYHLNGATVSVWQEARGEFTFSFQQRTRWDAEEIAVMLSALGELYARRKPREAAAAAGLEVF